MTIAAAARCATVLVTLAAAGCGTPKVIVRARPSSPANANGVSLLSRGLEGPARAAFEQALDEALRGADAHAEVDARLNLALLHLEASEQPHAERHLSLAIERMNAWSDLETEDRAVSWLVASEVAAALGRPDPTRRIAEVAGRLGHDADLLRALAACARGADGGADGERAVTRYARADRDAITVRATRCEARAALRRGDHAVALASVERALESDRRSQDPRALRDDLALAAHALERAGQLAEALSRWLEAARVDAATAHAPGLEEATRAIDTLAAKVGDEDRRRAAAVLEDLRERLARRKR